MAPLQPGKSPSPPSPDQDVREAIRAVFRSFSKGWQFDFLFGADSRADIDIGLLTGPSQLNSALTGRAKAIREHFSPADGSVRELFIRKNMLCIPAFSVGNISAGIAIEELAETNDFAADVTDKYEFQRYIRDNNQKKIIFISDVSVSSGTTAVRYVKHMSSTESVRVLSVFDSVGFRKAIYDSSRGNLAENLEGALLHMSIVPQSRSCPVCEMPVLANCNCKLESMLPAHPLDFKAERKRMLQFAGHFVGYGSLDVYKAGRKFAGIPMATSLSVFGKSNAGALNRLHQWAMYSRISKLKLNLNNTTMPTLASMGKERGTLGFEETCISTSPDKASHCSEDKFEGAADVADTRGGCIRHVKGEAFLPVSVKRETREISKAEVRRNRNCEAAARSNRKRKEKIDRLRCELPALKMLSEMLLEKEKALRIERRRLRNSLAGGFQ